MKVDCDIDNEMIKLDHIMMKSKSKLIELNVNQNFMKLYL